MSLYNGSDHESDDEPFSLRFARRRAASLALVPADSHSEDSAALSALPSFTGEGVDSVLPFRPLPDGGSDHESDQKKRMGVERLEVNLVPWQRESGQTTTFFK